MVAAPRSQQFLKKTDIALLQQPPCSNWERWEFPHSFQNAIHYLGMYTIPGTQMGPLVLNYKRPWFLRVFDPQKTKDKWVPTEADGEWHPIRCGWRLQGEFTAGWIKGKVGMIGPSWLKTPFLVGFSSANLSLIWSHLYHFDLWPACGLAFWWMKISWHVTRRTILSKNMVKSTAGMKHRTAAPLSQLAVPLWLWSPWFLKVDKTWRDHA